MEKQGKLVVATICVVIAIIAIIFVEEKYLQQSTIANINTKISIIEPSDDGKLYAEDGGIEQIKGNYDEVPYSDENSTRIEGFNMVAFVVTISVLLVMLGICYAIARINKISIKGDLYENKERIYS